MDCVGFLCLLILVSSIQNAVANTNVPDDGLQDLYEGQREIATDVLNKTLSKLLNEDGSIYKSVKVISMKGEYISGLEFYYIVELTHGSKHTRNCTVNIMENNSHIVIKCDGSKTEVDQTVKFT